MNSGGILSGPTIANEVREGHIRIEPGFDESRINPASYDLTLGSKVAVYKDAVELRVGGRLYEEQPDGSYASRYYATQAEKTLDLAKQYGDWLRPNPACILNTREKNPVLQFEMQADMGWLLKPGIGYLMHTAERIWTERYVPVLDGKSSLGRLFMTAHVTAGYGDPGFDGQYTLEVVVTQPIIVYPGMRFCQIRFHELAGPVLSYAKKGHYVGELAEGPIPSMAWKQFEEQQSGAK